MAPPVPTTEPTQATAGSTMTWRHASGTYPVSEGWTLSYSLNGVSKLTWSAGWVAADGQTVTIPAASTAVLKAGRYEFTRIFTGSGLFAGQRYTETLPSLSITADPATQAPGAAVATAETNLVAVEAAIARRVAGDEPVEYTIGGRSVTKMSMKELMQLRAMFLAEIRRLSGRARTRVVRFTQPSA
jgi:hypothetical protein